MAAYLALIRTNLRLTFRDRTVLFFNYLFPLIFFFVFAQVMHAEQGGMINQVVNMVLTIGVLGGGFFGAGMRAVADREQNILRRFKVAPISPMPILVSQMITGILHYLPVLFLVLSISHFRYGMAVPPNLLSVTIFVIAGVVAFRAMGLIVASVVNSMQESQLIIQVLYLPMLFLSGATFPISIMPAWVQSAAQFLPSTHFFTGMQAVLGAHESLSQNLQSFGALLLAAVLGLFIASKLFRWEKEDKVRASAKVWVAGVMAPFLLIGAYQAYSKENLAKNKVLERDMRRSRSLLIRNARVFTGDGTVIENGAVLIRNGHVAKVFTGQAPDAKALKAEEVEAAGKTLMPGLIDVHVHLGAPGGVYEKPADYGNPANYSRELAAYLYSGVTAVKSAGDALDMSLKQRERVARGEWLGAELFVSGPMFTTEGGEGTQFFARLPKQIRMQVEQQTLRLPKSPAEARQQVVDLAARGVNGITVALDQGVAGALLNRMELSTLRAIVEEAHARRLPVVVDTGDARDVADAVEAGADGVEHGSLRDSLSEETLALMSQRKIAYDPTLSVVESADELRAGRTDLLGRSLVQQVAPPGLLENTRKVVQSSKPPEQFQGLLPMAMRNLLSAYGRGCLLVTGTDSGNTLLVHGPAIHRELQLWVRAGVPAKVALQAATYNAARLLRADGRIGLIKEGHDATLLLVDGNPLEDISATERISMVLFKGERVDRTDLFKQE